jgi:hypothetical protein
MLKIHQRGKVFVRNLVIKCCKCDNTSDIMTSSITWSKLFDHSIHLVYGLRSIDKDRDAGKSVMCNTECSTTSDKF